MTGRALDSRWTARIGAAREAVARRQLLVPPPDFASTREVTSYRDALELLLASHAGSAGAPLHVYAHVPLCDEKCSFCMYYYSSAGRSGQRSEACAAQLRDLVRSSGPSVPVGADALYVGGGTPSVLSAEDLAAVLQVLTDRHPPVGDARFTVEMSPRSATQEKVVAATEGGANRISFGLQSFDPDVLASVHRQHTPVERLDHLVGVALAAGALDINVDLLHGLDGQPGDDLLRSTRVLVGLEVPTITMYRHRPLGPVDRERDDGAYVADELQRVEEAVDLAVAHGYECSGSLASECVRVYRSEHHRSLPRPSERSGYRTQADPLVGNHLVGYGSGAQSVGGGAVRFTCPHRAEFDADLGEREVEVWRSDAVEQYRTAVVRSLYWDRRIADVDLVSRFPGQTLAGALGEEIEVLERLGAATHDDGELRVTAPPEEWVVLEKVLYPQAWLDAAAAARRPVPSTLTLGTGAGDGPDDGDAGARAT